MRTISLTRPDDFDAWRDAARAMIVAQVPPEAIIWQSESSDLFAEDHHDTGSSGTLSVPRAFIDLARTEPRALAACIRA